MRKPAQNGTYPHTNIFVCPFALCISSSSRCIHVFRDRYCTAALRTTHRRPRSAAVAFSGLLHSPPLKNPTKTSSFSFSRPPRQPLADDASSYPGQTSDASQQCLRSRPTHPPVLLGALRKGELAEALRAGNEEAYAVGRWCYNKLCSRETTSANDGRLSG